LRFDELRFGHFTDDEGGPMSRKLLLRMCLKIICLGVFGKEVLITDVRHWTWWSQVSGEGVDWN